MRIASIIAACLVACTVQAEGLKILTKDYDVTDVVVKPCSVGLLMWTLKDATHVGAYGSIAYLTINEVRLEMGAAARIDGKLDLAALTGVSVPVGESFTIGGWYAPFWNLYKPERSDDPWGVMIGYRF